jgi:hypothetical protein
MRETLSSSASARVDGILSPARSRPSMIALRKASYTWRYIGVSAFRLIVTTGDIPGGTFIVALHGYTRNSSI